MDLIAAKERDMSMSVEFTTEFQILVTELKL